MFFAVNANWNGNGWNVNAYLVTNPNRWNDGNQVVSRYSVFSSALGAEVFAIIPFRHPPTIRPISSIDCPKVAYWLFGIKADSQEI